MLGVYLFTVKTMECKVKALEHFPNGSRSPEQGIQTDSPSERRATTFVSHGAVPRIIVDEPWALL